jgi:preprotein translocase subunit SecF
MNLLKYYKYLFAISGIILIFGIASLAIYGLRLGIDFKGGTISELQFKQSYDVAKVRDGLREAGISQFQLQTSDNNTIILKTEALDNDKRVSVYDKIKAQAGDFTELRLDTIGPVVGQQLRQSALIQLALVSFGIIVYIAYAFRGVTRPITSWQFGIAAIIALLHDLFVVLGIFSILGHYKGVEVDSLFVTAMLTVLGFSVHDTIVVFDRIRENLRLYSGQSMDFIVNHSISQTLVRSLNTSLSVLFVLFAMLLFGGDTIRNFVLALFIGIIAGTYSSIFVASPILAIWQQYRTRK